MSRPWHVDSKGCVDDAKRTDHISISNTKRMRTKPLVAGCSLALVFGSLQILPAQAQINGSWTSSFGKMELSSVGNRNYTGTYQDGKAKIHGKKNGNNLTGHWIKTSSSQRCKYAIDGSYYWGTVSLNFNSNNKSFNGNWGFCNDTRSGSWLAHVLNIMPIMPTIPILGKLFGSLSHDLADSTSITEQLTGVRWYGNEQNDRVFPRDGIQSEKIYR